MIFRVSDLVPYYINDIAGERICDPRKGHRQLAREITVEAVTRWAEENQGLTPGERVLKRVLGARRYEDVPMDRIWGVSPEGRSLAVEHLFSMLDQDSLDAKDRSRILIEGARLDPTQTRRVAPRYMEDPDSRLAFLATVLLATIEGVDLYRERIASMLQAGNADLLGLDTVARAVRLLLETGTEEDYRAARVVFSSAYFSMAPANDGAIVGLFTRAGRPDGYEWWLKCLEDPEYRIGPQLWARFLDDLPRRTDPEEVRRYARDRLLKALARMQEGKE
jgi:hypothetical protein